jgi:hypothetical protein
MPQPLNESDADELGLGQSEPGPRRRMRQMQRRLNLQIRAAEAQKATSQAMEKNARYMLWSVIVASLSTLVAAAAVVGVYLSIARAAH